MHVYACVGSAKASKHIFACVHICVCEYVRGRMWAVCVSVCVRLAVSMCVDALFCMPQSLCQLESERLTLVINI